MCTCVMAKECGLFIVTGTGLGWRETTTKLSAFWIYNPSDLFLNVLQPPLHWQAVQGTQTPLFSYQGQPKNKKQETHEQEKDSRLFLPRLVPSLGNWAEPPPVVPAVPAHTPSQEGPA